MMQVDELDFADDLTLLLHTQQQMQEKTTSVAEAPAVVGLNIHKGKSKIFRYNTTRTKQITLDEEALENVNTYTYLDSITNDHGGSDIDVKARNDKPRAAYLKVNNIWNSKQMSVNQHQGQNFQYKCQNSSTVWSGKLQNNESHHPQDTSVY
ncbi:unnamed protein product [Schistosoma mattheei]|uniref:Uncharacterized protein n=1 Tax=Schistosoma mattheei TaxID=31246 RepID=A0A183Q1Z6_9TREM|nr:unnamed protein product [Schistosoma mattheei]